MTLTRCGLAALLLLLAAGGTRAAPPCETVTVDYSAPRLVPLAGHVSVTRLAVRPVRGLDDSDPEYLPRSPQETAAFYRAATLDATREGSPRTNAIEVFTTRGPLRAWRLDFNGLSQNVEIRWLNEELLFLRAWWGRIVSTDLLFDVGNGRFLYAKEANYGQLTQPCEGAQVQ